METANADQYHPCPEGRSTDNLALTRGNDAVQAALFASISGLYITGEFSIDLMTLLSLNEALEHLNRPNLVNLATIEDNQPRVRCVTLFPCNGRFWVLTYQSRAKVRQLALNKNVEINFLFIKDKYQGQIRGRGFATEVKNLAIKKTIEEEVSWFKDYWSSAEDPDFCLYDISLKTLLVQYKGEFVTYVIED